MGLLCLVFALFVVANALDNGLGLKPIRGFNTWDSFRCDFDQADVIRTIDAITALKLQSFGWNYFNLDDCWATSRSADGTIVADEKKFPAGIAYLAAYAHSKGLLFGIYTDRGNMTCAGRPGSAGYEKQDARTYASWGVDLVKEDSCYATQDHSLAFNEYAIMRDALNATGRPILFSLCGWYSWYASEGEKLGNMWRMSGDVSSYEDFLRAADDNAPLHKFAGPGGFNDPDILISSSPNSTLSITPAQSRTQFNLWTIMASPLLIGANMITISQWDIATYTNTELLAVHDDVLGIQGQRVVGSNLHFNGTVIPGTNVWARPLSDGSFAVIFINTFSNSTVVSCDQNCLAKMSISPRQSFRVRDLWAHSWIGKFEGSFFAQVPGNGASSVFRFVPQK